MNEMPHFDVSNITTEHIIWFVHNLKLENAKCPTCNTEDWFGEGALTNSSIDIPVNYKLKNLTLAESITASKMSTSTPYFAMICSNCGYTKFYNKLTIYTWLQKNPKPLDKQMDEVNDI